MDIVSLVERFGEISVPIGADPNGVWLREWGPDDAATVLAAGRDPLVSRYRYSLPCSADSACEWVEQVSRDRQHGVRLELAIVENAAAVGSVSLTDFEHGNAMVRYWLLPSGRGRGLASRAVRRICDWAFKELAIGRIAAFVEPENERSAAVLERCGFVLEGRLRRHMVGHDGTRVDSLLYALLPDDLAEASVTGPA